MNYEEIYNHEYFSGKGSFFYKLGYGRFAGTFFDNKHKQIAGYIDKPGRVLDIGCAYGYMLQRFPETFEKFGLDVSEHAIDVAKKSFPNATFTQGNAEDNLPFDEDFFDIILLNDVLEHLENPKLALENIRSVLKKGGILYINTPNLNAIRKIILKYPDEKEHHVSMFQYLDLLVLLKDLGFDIVEKWTFLDVFFYFRFNSNIGIESAFICKKPD